MSTSDKDPNNKKASDELSKLDTGFSETLDKNNELNEKSKPEARVRTLTEKGIEYTAQLKANAARAAKKEFNDNVYSFQAFLVSSRDRDIINSQLDKLIKLGRFAKTKLEEWQELVKTAPEIAIIEEILSNIKDSVDGARGATFAKFAQLENEEKESVYSIKSHFSSRHSVKSYRSQHSLLSGSSTKETLINVKAKRAALEQKIKFSDAIQEQQKVLQKLKLQQQLSETIAEEAIYNDALQDDLPADEKLPQEQEKMIDRYIATPNLESKPYIYGPEFLGSGLTRTQPSAQSPSTLNPVPSSTSVFINEDNSNTPQFPKVSTNTEKLSANNSAQINKTFTVPKPSTFQDTSNPVSTLSTSAKSFVPHQNLVTVSSVACGARQSKINTISNENNLVASRYDPTPNAIEFAENHTPPVDNVYQIAEALAKVTQLQRLPQAKPDVFKGDEPETKFFLWETAFDALIDSAPITAQQKLYLLYQHLDGKAKKTVEQLQYMAANPEVAYNEARKKLKQRFGRPAIIASEFENKLTNWPKIASNDAQGIREFSDFLQQVETASAHLANLKIFEYPSKLQTLVEKLPNWFLTKWSTKVQTLQQLKGYEAFPSFSEFVSEVTFHADRLNIPQIARSKTSNVASENHQRRTYRATTMTTRTTRLKNDTPLNASVHAVKKDSQSSERLDNQKHCPFHKTKTHTLNQCQKFRELKCDERKQFFRKHKLCFSCAETDKHVAADCPKKPPQCEICHKRHVTALHQETEEDNPRASSSCTQVCGLKDRCRSCARIVLLNVSHELRPDVKILTYAVLDDQSTDVFVADSLINKLKAPSQELNLEISTIVGTNTVRTNKVSGLHIQDIDNRHTPIKVPYAYTREFIPATHQDIATSDAARQWKHLSSIANEIHYRPDVEIGMLIGRNIPAAFQPISVISGSAEEPWAEQYKFGWTIIGSVCKNKPDSESNNRHTASVNRVTVQRETLLGLKDSSLGSSLLEPPFVCSISTKETTPPSPNQVREMMELDYNEMHYSRKISGTEQAESIEDRKFREILSKGIHKTENGNLEAPLPFKTDDVSLPNNKKYCLRRLLALKRKLICDDRLKADYLAFMQKTLDRGHASQVPTDQLNASKGKVWYLPHFSVYHPRKPDQIRVVFDCSAVYDNESLNKHLLKGPDQLNSLIGVLTRFRKDEVAVTCDIEQMFHSFYVDCKHRDFLRFLWFQDNDLTKPIVDYHMDVHLFGAASSPGIANFCLHHTAETHREEYGNDAANFLQKDFYVDDGLISLPSVEQAVKLMKDTQTICAKNNLRLHKFASNKKEVLAALHVNDLAKDLKDLDLRHDTMPIQRSLGTYWCIESDTFGFRIELRDKPLTRRGILSTVSSVYDPLGAVSPVILVGKQILQALCRQNADWDDPVPEDVLPQWEKWRVNLSKLEKLNFPRCLKPPGFGPPVQCEIHSFSDASDTGIGQVSYLKVTNERKEVHVSFLMAKSRVAPLKPISIPRLELTAAVISANVSSMLRNELNYGNLQCVYHTDSEIVLGYIKNEARRFHVYVGNRVQHIRDRSNPEDWHHVQGKDNPADIASRGLHANELLQNSCWFNGPEFLLRSDALSAIQNSYALDPLDVEVRKDKATILSTKSNERSLSEGAHTVLEGDRFNHSSSFSRLKRSIVRIQRMIERIRKNKQFNWRPKEGPPLVEELNFAEHLILKSVQHRSFNVELDTLRKLTGNENKFEDRTSARERNLKVKITSSLYRLDPFVDKQGLIRVGGRLRNSNLPVEIKHPIIIPRNSHITTLLVRQYHHGKQHHQGCGMTHNAMRQAGFYLINGRSVVSHYISKCVTCRRLRGRREEQKMADLPTERITPAPPFTCTGMDVFGPYYIKEGRKNMKRWGIIFTCLASRAIHLETLNTMTTDSFINALRRFVSRRGKVRELRCDQGTNFVGANNEFAAAFKDLDRESIKHFLLSEDCDLVDFNFNVPQASHMGGVWERQIRTTKSVLSSLLKNHGTQLDDETLRTLLTEAESIVNSRPLTVESLSDPLAPEPLTPNHLLTLKSQIVLPPPGKFDPPDLYTRKRWRRVQYLANQFWLRWQKEYCALLQTRQKWNKPRRNLKEGDVVLVQEETPRNQWPLAMVTKSFPSKDNLVRKVEITLYKDGQRKTFNRPVHNLILLLPKEE